MATTGPRTTAFPHRVGTHAPNLATLAGTLGDHDLGTLVALRG